MMKDTKTEKDKLHRYLDDLYTREEASQLLQSIKEAENKIYWMNWQQRFGKNPGTCNLVMIWSGKNIRERHANY